MPELFEDPSDQTGDQPVEETREDDTYLTDKAVYVILMFNNSGPISVGCRDVNQHVQPSPPALDTLPPAIVKVWAERLAETLPDANIPTQKVREAEDLLGKIEEEAVKPRPDRRKLRRLAESLHGVLKNTAGQMLATGLLDVLAQALS